MKKLVLQRLKEIGLSLIAPILLFTANSLWGYQSILFREAKLLNLDPYVFTALRCFISVIFLFITATIFEGLQFHKTKDTLVFASLGFFGIFINQ
jgi:drug/metabolite transporter (DMT)-like permease